MSSIAVAILDFEQPGNRVVCVAGSDSSLIALLDERLSKSLRLADLQCHDRICIEAGAHHTVHRRRHGTDDGVSDASRFKELGDVGHQQRRLPRHAASRWHPKQDGPGGAVRFERAGRGGLPRIQPTPYSLRLR